MSLTTLEVEMKEKITLIVDAFINACLGILLLLFPHVQGFIGVPPSDSPFYPHILGAVFIGIAVALVLEAVRRDRSRHVGLGLTGAVAINLCGGLVLTGWLLFGNLSLPARGAVFLWGLAAVLVVISAIELILFTRGNHRAD